MVGYGLRGPRPSRYAATAMIPIPRQAAERWPHVAVVVASGHAEPGPGDLPEGATFIGTPFSAEIVRHHVRETRPDEKHPEMLGE